MPTRLKQGMQCCFVRRWCTSDIILSSAVPLLGWCGEKLFFLIPMFYSKYMFCRIFAIIQLDWMIYFATKSWLLWCQYHWFWTVAKAKLCRSRWSKDMPGSRIGSVFHLCLPVSCLVDPLLQVWLLQHCNALQWFHGCIPVEWSTGKKADHHFIAKRRQSDCRNILL